MKKGFTLIEILIVVGILGLVLPAVFTIIFSLIQEQTKILSLTEVKKQGDYSLSIMKNVISNYGAKIYYSAGSDGTLFTSDDVETCQGKTSTLTDVLYFKDKYGETFRFYSDPSSGVSKIASESSNFAPAIGLFSEKVRLDVSNPTITVQCSRSNTFSPPIIYIKFTAEYNTSSTNPEDNASMTFQTGVKMKNY